MNQLQHEQYRKVNQSEYPCSDHPKISLMRTENCAEGRSQTAEHPLNEYRRGLFPFWGDVLGGFFSLYSSGPVLQANLHTAAGLRPLCSRCS